jgi:2,4-dienoyl-CoA reductase-like NADH-dependent reductase (Old Yellow Enzyme family)
MTASITAREAPAAADLGGLFAPFDCAGLSLRNRVAMSPMTRCRSPGGLAGEDSEAYYTRRARGGVGLIFTEGVGVDHPAALGVGSMGEQNMPELHGGEALARWRAIVEAVHAEGTPIVPQLWHQGPVRMPGTGRYPDAPSSRPSGIWGPAGGVNNAIPFYLDQVRPEREAMSDADIAAVIDGFARSAANAAAVGFDGIALHGGHGYLIDSFLWSATNRRRDRWGGDARGRALFGAEVVRAVRRAAPRLPLFFRISQWKLQDYEARLADTPAALEALLAPLVDAGVDVFDVSARRFDDPAFGDGGLSLAGWVKKLSGRTTIAVGSIGLDRELRRSLSEPVAFEDNIARAARGVETGEFDMIALGRSLLADAAWVGKIEQRQSPDPFTIRALAEMV